MNVCLYGDRVRSTFRVHRLVLEAFVGPCPAGLECRHLDTDPLNNRLENLVWGTREENHADRLVMGRTALTGDQVRYIRGSSKSTRALAKELGCSQMHVSRVKRGISWRDVL